MTLTEPQRAVVRSNKRFKVIRAGRRFGKTVLAIEQLVFTAVDTKDARVVYIAPTFQSARDIAWEGLKKRIAVLNVQPNETRLEVDIPNRHGGTSKIMLRSWDSVETLRGQFFDLIILDEIAHIKNFWVNWQEVLRPTLTDRKGKAMFISTPSGFNHFYDLCNLELTDKEFQSFHFTSYDNSTLDKEELDKAKVSLPEDRFSQEYLAEFTKTTGLVYKQFTRALHLYEDDNKVPKTFHRYAGVDFGYRNPAAVAEILTDGDRFFISNEWYKTERTDTQIADYVAGCGFDAVYPDPENPSAIEELGRRRVNVREVAKGKGSVVAGISKIQELFKTGKLKIHKRCVNLISELESYSHDEEKDGKNANENPVKHKDHMLDAIRYCISMLLAGPSAEVLIRQNEQFRAVEERQHLNSSK